MTYSDYITDALRLIGVLMYTESADANQGDSGLRVLNNMMANWAADTVNVGYVPSETLTDDCDLHASVREAVTANLAVRLCPIYERQPSPVVAKMAADGWASLLMQASQSEQEEAKLYNLPRGSARRRWNIMTGTWY